MPGGVTPVTPYPGGVWSEAERPWRAASLVLAGATLISVVASTVRPSLFALPDVTLAGIAISLVLVTLGLLLLASPRSALPLGAFCVVFGVLAFPLALGGLLLGSLLVIGGGALAVGWSPVPAGTQVRWGAAGFPSRLAALVVDLLLYAPVLLGVAALLDGPMRRSRAVAVAVEAAVWLAVAVPGTATGASPGKRLLRLRVLPAPDRPSPAPAAPGARDGGAPDAPAPPPAGDAEVHADAAAGGADRAAGVEGAPAGVGWRAAAVREGVRAAELALLAALLVGLSGVVALRPLALALPSPLRSWPVGPAVAVLVVAALAAALRRSPAPHDLLAGTRVARGRLLLLGDAPAPVAGPAPAPAP